MTPHAHTHLYEGADRQALAVHCTLGHSGAWRGMAAALRDDLSLLAFDLPSHGKSGIWDRTGDVHDVCTAMARSVMQGPMDLIGHSFGATVALRIAVETPELVRSLTLVEPVFFAIAWADNPTLKADHMAASAALSTAFAAGDAHEAARLFNREWGDGTPWAALPERMRDHMAKLVHFVPASAGMLQEDSAGLLAAGRLSKAKMPAVLIEGDQSPPISADIAIALQKRLPDAQRVVVKGAGHMLPLTHPKQVAEPVRALRARS